MSSVASYQDVYGDQVRKWRNPHPYPLIAIEQMGLGQILLISDPSILINGMLRQLDNEILANNTLFFLGDGRNIVYFDESHRNYFDPVTISVITLGQLSDYVKGFVVALIAIVLLSFLTDYPRLATREIFNKSVWLWRSILNALSRKKAVRAAPSPLTDEKLVIAVMERHPDWKRNILTSLLAQAEYHRKIKWW